jgi:hypothetical protein
LRVSTRRFTIGRVGNYGTGFFRVKRQSFGEGDKKLRPTGPTRDHEQEAKDEAPVIPMGLGAWAWPACVTDNRCSFPVTKINPDLGKPMH